MPVQFLSAGMDPGAREAPERERGLQDGGGLGRRDHPERDQHARRPQALLDAVRSGSVKLEAGDAEKADATIEQDYDTAVALAKSELNPVSAFMTGKIRINGSMMLLMQLQGALSELAKEMQEIDVDY